MSLADATATTLAQALICALPARARSTLARVDVSTDGAWFRLTLRPDAPHEAADLVLADARDALDDLGLDWRHLTVHPSAGPSLWQRRDHTEPTGPC